MNLYELTKDMQELEYNIEMMLENDTEKETVEELENIKNLIADMVQSKSENIIKVIRNWDSDIESIDLEIARLTELKKKRKNKIDSLKEYTLDCLQASQIKKIETALGNITVRKGTGSVSIIDADKIPKEYKKEKVTIDIDKTSIKKALAEGQLIEGAELIIKNSLLLPQIKK